MRVRMIRPAYWTDADLHTRLTADQREFYIGLWMLADDEGYVAWDPDRVGAELYPYRSATWRAKRLADWLAVIGPDHAKLLDCGLHVYIRNLKRYQTPPRPTSMNQKAHDVCMREHMNAREVSGGHVTSVREVKEGKGVVKGLNGGAPALDETTTNDGRPSFASRVPRPA